MTKKKTKRIFWFDIFHVIGQMRLGARPRFEPWIIRPPQHRLRPPSNSKCTRNQTPKPPNRTRGEGPPPSTDPPILAADSSEELAGTPSGTPTQTPIAASLTAQKSLAIMQIIKILVELRRECLYKIIRNLDRKYWYTIFKRFRIYLNFNVIFLAMCWIYHLSQWNKPEFIYLRSWEWLPDVLRVVLSCRFIDILVFVFAASSCLAIKINKSFWTVAIVRLYENSAAISAKNFTNIKKKTTELQIKT